MAGVKGKYWIISMELPIITTPIGSEGLSVHLDGVDFPGYVAKTVEEFKHSAVQCLSVYALNRMGNSCPKSSLKERLDVEYGIGCVDHVENAATEE